MSAIPKTDKLIIAAAFICAAILLFVNLGGKAYWSDEIFSLPKIDNPKVVIYQSSFDVHPPLFFLLEYYWIQLFGKSETAARALPALFGLLGMIVSFLLARKLIPARNLKWFAILIAISAFYLFYARMARYYSLTSFLSITTMFFYLRMVEKREINREILYWLSALLLIYTDYIGFFVIFSQGLFFLWSHRRTPKIWIRYIAGGLIIFILYIPWMSNLLFGAEAGTAPYPADKMSAGKDDFRLVGFIIYNTIQSVIRIGYTAFNFTLGETVYPWNPLILFGAAGSVSLFIASAPHKAGKTPEWVFLLFLPFLMYILSAVFYSKVFSASNFALIPSKIMFLQPLWMMFLLRGENRTKTLTAGALLLLVFYAIALFNYHRGAEFLNPKYTIPWKQIVGELENDSSAGDIIVTDEEPILLYLKGSHFKAYGIVGAVEYIAEQKPPFKVRLVMRRRGEESIFEEGIKLRDKLKEVYGQPDYKGYGELIGIQKKLWGDERNAETENIVLVYTFQVVQKENTGNNAIR